MTEWTVVFWSSARQIAEEAELPRALWPDGDIAPRQFFESLRAADQPVEAIAYVAAALPKLEAIEWGLASLPPIDRDDPDYAARMLLRDSARRWLQEPDDENRRAIERLVDTAEQGWPETLIGLAIFFSGGSIAPEDSMPVPPDPRLPGQLIAGTVQSVVAASGPASTELTQTLLDLGDRLAAHGRQAVAGQ